MIPFMIFPSDLSLSKHADSERWHNADEATKLQLTSLWGTPGEWNVSSVTNMNLKPEEFIFVHVNVLFFLGSLNF